MKKPPIVYLIIFMPVLLIMVLFYVWGPKEGFWLFVLGVVFIVYMAVISFFQFGD